MNQAAKITFLIPYYSKDTKRGLFYLKKAIQSVLMQNISNWLCIIVDDRSPSGGAKELVESFKDDRISYVLNEENLGIAGNWNKCVSLASTPFYSLLHSDDELKENYASTVLQGFHKNPDAAAVFTNAEIIDSSGNTKFSIVEQVKKIFRHSGEHILSGERGVTYLLKANVILCPTVSFQKKLIPPTQQFNPEWKLVLDIQFWLDLLINGYKMVGLPTVAYRYREHDANCTTSGREDMSVFQEESKLYDHIQSISLDRGWNLASSEASKKRMIKLRICFYMIQDLVKFKIKFGSDKFKLLLSL